MRRNRKIIYLAGFLCSIPVALTAYINSSFLETYVNKYNVGTVYIVASVLTILGMLLMPKILTRLGNRKTTLVFALLIFLSFILLAFGRGSSIVIPAFILCFVSVNFLFASLDIFIEDFSKNSAIGTMRGFYLMIINGAWVVAQLISGSIIAKSSFRGIYLLSALFMVLVSFMFFLFLRDFEDPKYRRVSVIKTMLSFWHKKNLLRIYLINLILKFFFAWMIIYTPIYLHEYIGFGWDKIGIIFTIMLLPFLFFDSLLGRLSDKVGEKKILAIGFIISGLATAMIPLVLAPELWLWAGILFMTRVGAATIEVMSESYFFKSVKEESADALSFFRNTTPLSYLIGPLVAIPILIFVPSFKYLFFVLSAVLFLGLFITLRLRDVK